MRLSSSFEMGTERSAQKPSLDRRWCRPCQQLPRQKMCRKAPHPTQHFFFSPLTLFFVAWCGFYFAINFSTISSHCLFSLSISLSPSSFLSSLHFPHLSFYFSLSLSLFLFLSIAFCQSFANVEQIVGPISGQFFTSFFCVCVFFSLSCSSLILTYVWFNFGWIKLVRSQIRPTIVSEWRLFLIILATFLLPTFPSFYLVWRHFKMNICSMCNSSHLWIMFN